MTARGENGSERERCTVVVGLDGSPEAQDALAWTRRRAGPRDRILAVRAWDVPIAIGYDIVEAIDVDEVERATRQDLADTIDAIGDDRLVPVLHRGHPGSVVVDEAADAHLVVVGHRGDSRISLMLGSTANYVVHHAPCPAIIVRGTYSDDVRRVVVGVDGDVRDGTSPSVRALQWAYGLDGVEEITVLHAWEIPVLATGLYGGVPLGPGAFEDEAEALIGCVMDAAGEPPPNVEIRHEVTHSSSSRALVTASEHADLVVVGSRGRGGLAELVLGSTSSAVAAHSHAPVAVIK